MAPKRYTKPDRDEVKPILFELEGIDGKIEKYTFTPPQKSTISLALVDSLDEEAGIRNLIAMRGQLDWIGDGLSEDEGQRLHDRLRDPKDWLDTNVVNDLYKDLVEQSSGRPTKRRLDS